MPGAGAGGGKRAAGWPLAGLWPPWAGGAGREEEGGPGVGPWRGGEPLSGPGRRGRGRPGGPRPWAAAGAVPLHLVPPSRPVAGLVMVVVGVEKSTEPNWRVFLAVRPLRAFYLFLRADLLGSCDAISSVTPPFSGAVLAEGGEGRKKPFKRIQGRGKLLGFIFREK